MKRREAFATGLAGMALVLCAVQWVWTDWRMRTREEGLRETVHILQAEVCRLQRSQLPTQASEGGPPDDLSGLQRALERLGEDTVLERYQAGLTVRGYGERAVPELVEIVCSGNDRRAGESALLLLADMRSPQAVKPLREFANRCLSGQVSGSVMPDEKTLAGILGILASCRDGESAALFERGVESRSESVRMASMAGLRRLDAVDLLPALASRLGKETGLAARQLERTVTSLCQCDPGRFVESLNVLPPPVRFQVVQVLGKNPSAACRQGLRALTGDVDARVALTAAHLLARKGDMTGRVVAERLAGNAEGNAELKRLAEAVLEQLE